MTSTPLTAAAPERPTSRLLASAKGARSSLLLAPAFLVLSVLLFMPLLQLAALSVGSGSFEPYVRALGDPLYARVVGQTFQIASISTVICLVLAYPLAYAMATTTPRLRIVCLLLVALPFWTSVLVRTYAWMVLLGRNGIINRLLIDNNVIAEPLPLIYNKAGVILGTVYYLLPFMVLPIFAAMIRIDRQLLLAAEGLGASAARRFLNIYFPLTLGGIGAGAALVFILALSAFITPALLGGGRVIMITNLIYTQVSELLDWPFAAALSVLILLTTVVAYSGIGLLTRRRWN